MTRALDKDAARALLTDWRQSRESCEAKRQEFPRIIERCLDAGLTKTEIAEAAGFSRTTIHNYVRKRVAT